MLQFCSIFGIVRPYLRLSVDISEVSCLNFNQLWCGTNRFDRETVATWKVLRGTNKCWLHTTGATDPVGVGEGRGGVSYLVKLQKIFENFSGPEIEIQLAIAINNFSAA